MVQSDRRPPLEFAGGISIETVQPHAAQEGRDRAAWCA
jgi:hypothetical protein